MVRTAGHPTSIKCDCESVVNITLRIIQGHDVDTDELADGDLWTSIKELVMHAPKGYFRCIWIPSDCGDEGNEDKKQKMLSCGAITLQQITGNEQADELAKLGAALHQVEERILLAQDHRKKVARIYQYMMVDIWSRHFETFVDSKGKPITPDSSDDLPQCEDMGQHDLDYNDDD